MIVQRRNQAFQSKTQADFSKTVAKTKAERKAISNQNEKNSTTTRTGAVDCIKDLQQQNDDRLSTASQNLESLWSLIEDMETRLEILLHRHSSAVESTAPHAETACAKSKAEKVAKSKKTPLNQHICAVESPASQKRRPTITESDTSSEVESPGSREYRPAVSPKAENQMSSILASSEVPVDQLASVVEAQAMHECRSAVSGNLGTEACNMLVSSKISLDRHSGEIEPLASHEHMSVVSANEEPLVSSKASVDRYRSGIDALERRVVQMLESPRPKSQASHERSPRVSANIECKSEAALSTSEAPLHRQSRVLESAASYESRIKASANSEINEAKISASPSVQMDPLSSEVEFHAAQQQRLAVSVNIESEPLEALAPSKIPLLPQSIEVESPDSHQNSLGYSAHAQMDSVKMLVSSEFFLNRHSDEVAPPSPQEYRAVVPPSAESKTARMLASSKVFLDRHSGGVEMLATRECGPRVSANVETKATKKLGSSQVPLHRQSREVVSLARHESQLGLAVSVNIESEASETLAPSKTPLDSREVECLASHQTRLGISAHAQRESEEVLASSQVPLHKHSDEVGPPALQVRKLIIADTASSSEGLSRVAHESRAIFFGNVESEAETPATLKACAIPLCSVVPSRHAIAGQVGILGQTLPQLTEEDGKSDIIPLPKLSESISPSSVYQHEINVGDGRRPRSRNVSTRLPRSSPPLSPLYVSATSENESEGGQSDKDKLPSTPGSASALSPTSMIGDRSEAIVKIPLVMEDVERIVQPYKKVNNYMSMPNASTQCEVDGRASAKTSSRSNRSLTAMPKISSEMSSISKPRSRSQTLTLAKEPLPSMIKEVETCSTSKPRSRSQTLTPAKEPLPSMMEEVDFTEARRTSTIEFRKSYRTMALTQSKSMPTLKTTEHQLRCSRKHSDDDDDDDTNQSPPVRSSSLVAQEEGMRFARLCSGVSSGQIKNTSPPMPLSPLRKSLHKSYSIGGRKETSVNLPYDSDSRHVFWTGGFDSTWRIVQALLIEGRTVVPIYLSGSIDNYSTLPHSRKSKKFELAAMQAIRDEIIQCFPLAGDRLKSLVVVPEVVLDRDLIHHMKTLKSKDMVKRQRCQMGSMAQLSLNIATPIDVGVVKGEFLHERLQDFLERKDDGWLISLEAIESMPALAIFKWLRFPLLASNKEDILEQAKDQGYERILQMTWSCWYPRRGEPCGKCAMCKSRILQ